MARTSSGSARSDREVNSTRSTNRTETTLRSSGAGAVRTNGEPQFWQYRAVSEFCSPQVGHRTTGRVYPAFRSGPAANGAHLPDPPRSTTDDSVDGRAALPFHQARLMSRDKGGAGRAVMIGAEAQGRAGADTATGHAGSHPASVWAAAAPETRYAKSEDGYVAYQVFGRGSFDLLFIGNWASNVEVMWEH